VDEGDLEAEEPGPRSLVDQLRSVVGEMTERGGKVADLVRDVVHAGPSLGEELSDRRVRAEGFHQLDPPLAEPQRRSLDTLVLDRGTVLDARAEQALVGLDRLVEVVDCHPDMVDPQSLHGSDAS
jgi:hypothetical protein